MNVNRNIRCIFELPFISNVQDLADPSTNFLVQESSEYYYRCVYQLSRLRLAAAQRWSADITSTQLERMVNISESMVFILVEQHQHLRQFVEKIKALTSFLASCTENLSFDAQNSEMGVIVTDVPYLQEIMNVTTQSCSTLTDLISRLLHYLFNVGPQIMGLSDSSGFNIGKKVDQLKEIRNVVESNCLSVLKWSKPCFSGIDLANGANLPLMYEIIPQVALHHVKQIIVSLRECIKGTQESIQNMASSVTIPESSASAIMECLCQIDETLKSKLQSIDHIYKNSPKSSNPLAQSTLKHLPTQISQELASNLENTTQILMLALQKIRSCNMDLSQIVQITQNPEDVDQEKDIKNSDETIQNREESRDLTLSDCIEYLQHTAEHLNLTFILQSVQMSVNTLSRFYFEPDESVQFSTQYHIIYALQTLSSLLKPIQVSNIYFLKKKKE